jgi:SAM-dependent methyltransferase
MVQAVKPEQTRTLFFRIGMMLKPPDPSFHYRPDKLVQLLTSVSARHGRILDVGSGSRKFNDYTITVDIEKHTGVGVVADASALPFKSRSFDMVVNTAVLEHVKFLDRTLLEMRRVLLLNGWIYSEVPFLQSYHAHPNDYRRFTLPGLDRLFDGYKKESSGVCVGPFSSLAWLVRKMPRYLLGGGLSGLVAEFFAGWLTFWFKYFDALLPAAKRAHEVASGLYFVGQKIIE